MFHIHYKLKDFQNELSDSSKELMQDTLRRQVIGVSLAFFLVWMFVGMAIPGRWRPPSMPSARCSPPKSLP